MTRICLQRARKRGGGVEYVAYDEENFPGVEYVAFDKEYEDEALDNDEYDKKNDEIDLIEKHLMLILMYIHIMNQNYYKLTEEV